MPRLLVLLILAPLLLLVAVACASDDQDGTGTAPNQETSPIDATPAVAPPDQEAYRQSIVGQGAVQETCTYIPEQAVADCLERGIFKLDPPPSDDVSCVVGLSGGDTPQFVLCSSPAGGDLKFFVIGP